MRARSNVVHAPKTARSRVTNGTHLFVSDVDGRTKEARRFRDIVAEITADLGGFDGLSEGQKQLAKRAAMMSVQCEAMEAKAVAGEDIDVERYGSLSDRIGRAFHRLGLKRVTKTISNPIADHFDRPYRHEGA